MNHSVIISEICSNGGGSANSGDWVELFNRFNTDLDISGWRFHDAGAGNVFIFPEGSILPAGGYGVIARDLSDFQSVHIDASPLFGNFDFGLRTSDDFLRIVDAGGRVQDQVHYRNDGDWTFLGDLDTRTRVLRETVNFSDAGSFWQLGPFGGSPGTGSLVSSASRVLLIPQNFELKQNFPNPFNPSTNIRYALPRRDHVRLCIYDFRGALVQELVNAEQEAGWHQVRFLAHLHTGGDLASGVYFYRLEVGDKVATEKMLLLK